MKKNVSHIIYAWLLLFCFVAGQYMVYAHQHYVNKNSHSLTNAKGPAHASLSEKCSVCDSMHHAAMDLTTRVSYTHVAVSSFIYKTFQYDFKSIALILSPGRAPPVIP